MKSSFLIIASSLFIFTLTSCKKEQPNNRQSATYQIDSIVFNMFDTSGVVSYRYTFRPNDDGVFASVDRSNDTITYLSKYDAGIETFNSNSTVQAKANRIFKSSYFTPIGMFGQDGYTFHEYHYYNTNNKLDSIVHITSGNYDGIPADTTSETYYFFYENDNLTRVTLNGADNFVSVHYSVYSNQKALIGLDINEFLGFGLIVHINNSDGFLNGVKDDILEFQKNCVINNFNSISTNSQYLIDSVSSGVPINYTFDASNNNRIKEISAFNGTQKLGQYKFYYRN